jgi:hypothetical protein
MKRMYKTRAVTVRDFGYADFADIGGTLIQGNLWCKQPSSSLRTATFDNMDSSCARPTLSLETTRDPTIPELLARAQALQHTVEPMFSWDSLRRIITEGCVRRCEICDLALN